MSARYYALIEGSGDGCDYTIKCNQMYLPLKAQTEAAANIEIENIFMDYCGDPAHWGQYNEREFESVTIVEAARVLTFDVQSFISRRKKSGAEQKRTEQDAKDLAEFERLKNKLGK